MLVTKDILKNIVDQTNLYADQFFVYHGTIKPRSRLHMEKDFQYGCTTEIPCLIDDNGYRETAANGRSLEEEIAIWSTFFYQHHEQR